MLEIGPGEGDFLYAAREQGFDAYGVELDPLRADFIRQRLGIPCEHSSLDTSVFAGNEFDVIYHRNVLSHFYDPISEFKKINSRLRPGGIHVFETGNWGDVERRYFKSTNSFHYPNHLFFFSSTSLRQLLFRTGFELVAIYRFCKLPELILRKILEHPVPSGLASVSTTRNGDSEPISGLKRIVADVVSCIMYFITYKLGHVLLKKQSLPQTMILVTRKTGYGEKV
jgi:SAM-dependent methyltransferase